MTENSVSTEFLRRRIAELESRADSLSDRGVLSTVGGGSGSGSGMEARLAKVESTVEHIQTDISEIKGDLREIRKDMRNDFRILFGALITATLAMAGLLAHGFKWI